MKDIDFTSPKSLKRKRKVDKALQQSCKTKLISSNSFGYDIFRHPEDRLMPASVAIP